MSNDKSNPDNIINSQAISRRQTLKLTATVAVSALVGALIPALSASASPTESTPNQTGKTMEKTVSPKAFVYAELQISVPFGQVPGKRSTRICCNNPVF